MECSSPAEILRCAETLGIPWTRLLVEEIEAEQRLRTYLRDVDAGCPLDSALAILTHAALKSWRVRDRIEGLAIQARSSVRGATARLRRVVRNLAGQSEADSAALARHCRFAYERVLLLQRARRAGRRSRGTAAERLAFVCSSARCAFDDAEWAIREEDAPRPGHRMEAAVRKVRDEGFLVPRAPTEARSLAELRRIVFSSSPCGRRRVSTVSGFGLRVSREALTAKTPRSGFRYSSPRTRLTDAS